MAYENIIIRQEGKVGVAQLNRPKAMNALNGDLMRELIDALRIFDADENIGCMIITGNEKSFAAGADIKQMADKSAVGIMNDPFIYYWDDLAKIAKPVVAAVSGWCLGGGCELAMACDMIVASESAKFGQPEINLGIIPGAGGTQRLTRAVGKALAMEIVLNDRKLSAHEAAQHGLVNRVVPAESYMVAAMELASAIADRAPVAVRIGKEAVNKVFETSLAEGVHLERRLFNMLFATDDQTEGMAAFVEKRKPKWAGK